MAQKNTKVKPNPVVIINDDYQVSLDSKSLILRKKPANDDKELSKEEAKDGMRILGYYLSWEHLGKSLMRDMIRCKVGKKEKVNVQEFLDVVNTTYDEVNNLFKGIDKKLDLTK